jgi:hypothetical protein
VDLVEFTRVELRGVDAIDKRTTAVMLYDLRINGFDLNELSDADSPQKLHQMHEPSSQERKKWGCTGDPMPELIRWAQSKWGDDPEKLPNRAQLLQVFREQVGPIRGINEHTMREVRRQLAPERARRGGAPMHRRQPGK